MSVEQYKLQLNKVEQEIKDLTSSEEYKLFAKKNRAWEALKPTDQEKGEWLLLQEQLSKLKEKKKFWQNVILNSTASHVRQQHSIRKKYKKKSAAKSSSELLTAIADHLYSVYRFETKSDDPTFQDVLEAAQFKSRKAILDHFSPNAKNKTSTDGGDIRYFFTKDQWLYFLKLNFLVNAELHSSLSQSDDGKITILLPSTAFQPKLVQAALEQIGFDATQVGYQEC